MTQMVPTPFPQPERAPEQVCFDRREFGVIFSLYGRMVASGEWRDYGISTLREVAVFAIFRRAKQGMFSVVAMDGRILRRGHDLAQVLRVLEPKAVRLVD